MYPRFASGFARITSMKNSLVTMRQRKLARRSSGCRGAKRSTQKTTSMEKF